MGEIITKLLETTAKSWTDADRRYQLHHVNCPRCKAAGKGHGDMCEIGEMLWIIYEDTPIPPEKLGRAKRVAGGELPPEPPINPAPDGDMACCSSCRHMASDYRGNVCRGRGNELSGLPLARQFAVHLHRCAGLAPKTSAPAKHLTSAH